MPRPNPAQFVYGSATVILSTLAMLLASPTRSGVGVTVVACVALALGLVVALRSPSRSRRAEQAPRPVEEAPLPERHRAGLRVEDERRTPQPSLRR